MKNDSVFLEPKCHVPPVSLRIRLYTLMPMCRNQVRHNALSILLVNDRVVTLLHKHKSKSDALRKPILNATVNRSTGRSHSVHVRLAQK